MWRGHRRLWPPSRCVFESGGPETAGGFQWRVWQPASSGRHIINSRRVEVVADGLPQYGGVQLAVNTTLVSPLHCDRTATRHTAHVDGAVLEVARRKMEATHPELVAPRARARLVVWAGEVNGRWSEETRAFLSLLAKAEARSETPVMRRRVEQAWRMRWGATPACTAARASAASLLNLRLEEAPTGRCPPPRRW